MPRINIKYPIGTKVAPVYKGGSEGLVTGIFVRGKNRTYEYSYIDSDGNPKNAMLDEVEITSLKSNNRLGFNKEDK